MASSLKICYILLYFPRLTETFVANEIHSIRSRDIDVEIVSLLPPGSGPVQTLSQKLLSHVWNAPGFLNWDIWKAQFHFLATSGSLYFHLLFTLLKQPCPSPYFTFFFKRLVIFLKAVAVAHHLLGKEIDLLHTHFAWLSGAATWICARLLGIPFTVTVHAFDIFSTKNDLLRLVCREASHVISISEFNRSYLVDMGILPAEAVSVVHCGIELTKFDSRAENMTTSPDAPLRILSVGSLVEKKGHAYLIDACAKLKEKGGEFVCTIMGGGPDEPVLRRQIRSHGLSERIILEGAKSYSDVVNAYRTHDVFVLASVVAPDGDKDGIPVVLMEAGMMGMALISTSVSGIPELVRDRHTGLLVEPHDSAALSDAIALLATDSDLRTRLGKNARALVESKFDIEKNVAQLAGLFRTTCEEHCRGIDRMNRIHGDVE